MSTCLAGQNSRLSYIRDPAGNETFDPCRVLDDVHEDGAVLSMQPWQSGLRMAASDHLVVATDSGDGRCLGVIAASDHGTEREPFLFIDAAYLAPSVPAIPAFRRMLAFAILRIAGTAAVPNIIAACARQPYVAVLRAFGQCFGGAALFPPPPRAAVTDLGVAALARRIARVARPGARCDVANGTFHAPASAGGETLVVLDLSIASDDAILDEARRLYRARPARAARHGMAANIAGTAPRPAAVRGATAM